MRGIINTILVFEEQENAILSFLPKKSWDVHYSKCSEELLHKLYRIPKKNILIYIKLPINDDALLLIQKIREYSHIPGIIIHDTRLYYSKAYTYLKSGACLYLHGKMSKNNLKNKFSSLIENLLYPRKWLQAFQEDNVFARNTLHAHKQLITYKLQSSLIRKTSPHFTKEDALILQTDDKISTYNNRTLNKKECLSLLSHWVKKPLYQLSAAEIIFIGDTNTLDIKTLPFVSFKQINTFNIELILASPANALAICNLAYEKLPKTGKEWLNIIQTKILYIQQEKNLSDLTQLFHLGITNIYTQDSEASFEKRLFRLWLDIKFPYFSDRIDIQALSFVQRLCFFEYILEENKRKNKAITQLDILALFPEFYPDLMSPQSQNQGKIHQIFTASSDMVSV